jgi:hypothetical protein
MKLPAAPPGEISVPLRTPFGRVFASPRPRVAGFLFYSNNLKGISAKKNKDKRVTETLCNPLILLVRPARFELATYGFVDLWTGNPRKSNDSKGFNHFRWLDPFCLYGLLKDNEGNRGIFSDFS